MAEHALELAGFFQPIKCDLRVGIAYEEASLECFAAGAMGCNDSAFSFLQLGDFCSAIDFAPCSLNVAYERVDNQVATALQPPTALYVAAQPVGQGEQRQRVAAQLHPHGRCRQHIDQQWVAEQRGQIFIGINANELFHRWQLAQHFHELPQRNALLGEILTQLIGETVEPLRQGKRLVADSNLVEAIRIEPLPWQREKAKGVESFMQSLPRIETADIMQSRIKLKTCTTVALQASARLLLTFKHNDASSALSQLAGTD